MSYGLNVEMHKQTEIGKRLDAILRQVLPFLSGEVSSGSKARPRPFSNSKNVFPFAAPTASRDGRGESQANHHGRTERGNAGKADKCIYLLFGLAPASFQTSIRSSLGAIDSYFTSSPTLTREFV